MNLELNSPTRSQEIRPFVLYLVIEAKIACLLWNKKVGWLSLQLLWQVLVDWVATPVTFLPKSYHLNKFLKNWYWWNLHKYIGFSITSKLHFLAIWHRLNLVFHKVWENLYPLCKSIIFYFFPNAFKK